MFDLVQFNKFISVAGNEFQIWPGVELDVFEGDRKEFVSIVVGADLPAAVRI